MNREIYAIGDGYVLHPLADLDRDNYVKLQRQIEGDHDNHFYTSETFSNQNRDHTRQVPRKSLLTFRRSKVNSDTLICPLCVFIIDSDCKEYNMFWKCERCGFCEGIE